ncbi:MAG: hypothetical protein KME23_12585 [Goleter apudmare HA4340-LM2]|jgi:hypothetical protein|nr:hypothetical protein [Goleter apudmare HA4340-LM2]
MFSSKLLTGSLLAFSVVSAAFFGATIPTYAGAGGCGDSSLLCKEPQTPKQPTATIKYMIANNTKKTIKFTLPSGKIYQLAPGQKGSYRNTTTKDRLRLFLIDQGKYYPLKDGNYQFRENPHGQILLARAQIARRNPTRPIRVVSPSRSQTPELTKLPKLVGTILNPLNETSPEPQTEEPGLQEPDIVETGTSTNSASDGIGLEIIREIAGIVKTAIIANSPNNQNTTVEENNQPTIVDDENSTPLDSQTTESNDLTTSSLPVNPPQIAQVGGSVDEVLNQWGWTKISCTVGNPLVVITGLGDGAVCVNPTPEIAAGKYKYNRTSHQLTPLNQ